MKKHFLIYLLGMLLICVRLSFAHAAPFLACDPQDGVTEYQVEIDGVVESTTVTAESDGSLRYDLAGFASGSYTIRLQAGCPSTYTGSDGSTVTEMQWSDWSDPFDLTVDVCGAGLPAGTTIVP